MTERLPLGLPDPTPYLLPEETIRLVVRRHHPIVLSRAGALVVITAIVTAWGLAVSDPSGGMVAFGLGVVGAVLLYFGYRCVQWSRTVLVITNRRLFQFVSLGIKRVTVMPVIRQSIVFRQSPIGRAMGFGTVQVKTPNGAVLHSFPWLGDPARFRDEVTDIAA